MKKSETKKVAEDEKKLISPSEAEADHDDHHHHEENIDDTLKPPNKVNIWISCKHLPNLDYGFENKTDPFVRVYVREEKKPDWILIGETEVINNNLNPEFNTIISLNYYFEK